MTSLRSSLGGLALCAAAGLLAWRLAAMLWNGHLQLSALMLAIAGGILIGNLAGGGWITRFQPGIKLSQQKLLRLGIILYGIRLTAQDLLRLGPRALALDVTVIAGILLFGYWIGTRLLRLDPETALLVSCGSGICGAAAVLAADRVIESESHKTSVAVATVVVFGTAAMFLYPLLYPLTGFSERQFGIYAGATVHEVAHVVAVGRAVGQVAGDTAVLTKMLRVLLLAPALLVVGRVRRGGSARPVVFPWFVLGFLAVILGQSFYRPAAPARAALIEIDTVLLASAMFALGLGTRWEQMRKAGTRPLLLAALLFAVLVGGGYVLTAAFAA